MLECKLSLFPRLLTGISIIAWLKENSVCGLVTKIWKHMKADVLLRPKTERTSEKSGTGSKRTHI